jgi:hypothetical protein
VLVLSVLLGFASAGVSPALAREPGIAPDAGAKPQSPELEARRLFERAQHEYAEGRYEQALSSLREAYALWPRPGFLFNIAQAERKLGKCVAARTSYQEYLVEEADPQRRQRAVRLLRSLSDCGSSTPSETVAESELDTQAADATRAPRARETSARDASAALAESRQPARSERTPLARPAKTTSRGGRSPVTQIVQWSLLGAAAGAGGLALFFALDARSTSADISNATAWNDELARRYEHGERSAVRAQVLAGASAILAGAGVTVHLLGRSTTSPSAALRLTYTPDRYGAACAASF